MAQRANGKDIRLSYRQCCFCLPHGETLIFILALVQGFFLVWTAISQLMQIKDDKVFVATSGNATIDAAETVINNALNAESRQITLLSALQLSCGILMAISAIIGISLYLKQSVSRTGSIIYGAVFALVGAYFAVVVIMRILFLIQQRKDIIRACTAADAPSGAFPACLAFIPFESAFAFNLAMSGLRCALAIYFSLFVLLSAIVSGKDAPFSSEEVKSNQNPPRGNRSSTGRRPHRRNRSLSIVDMPLPENEEVGNWTRRDSLADRDQNGEEKVTGLNMDENDFVSYSTRHQRFVNDKTGEFVNVNL